MESEKVCELKHYTEQEIIYEHEYLPSLPISGKKDERQKNSGGFFAVTNKKCNFAVRSFLFQSLELKLQSLEYKFQSLQLVFQTLEYKIYGGGIKNEKRFRL
ncbi:MAG: hypothetical protein J6W52_12090 [Bacteroidaceae bacterium]|nr:hypothetical protein [Bacteroidaceae bacterium]